jgi:hypothetical protein
MKYYIAFIFILILQNNKLYSQNYFSKVYPNYNENIIAASGIFPPIFSDKSGESIFISAHQILNSPYINLSASKIDHIGNIVWHKIIKDSLSKYFAEDGLQLSDNRIVLCGGKYISSEKKYQFWVSIFSSDFLLDKEYIFPSEFDNSGIKRIKLTKNGEFLLAGFHGKFNNLGVASEKGRAMVMRVDTLGNVKWYHEFYDSTDEKELHGFSGITEDEDGNIYVSGANGNRDGNGDLIMAKINREGNVVWYKQYPSQDSEGLACLYMQKDGSILGIGGSGDPNIFTRSWVKVMVMNLDQDGNIMWTKKHSLRYHIVFSNCIESGDGNYVCTGVTQDTIEPDGKDNRDGVLQKISPNGDVIWERQYGNWNRRLEGFWNLSKAYDGGYYLGGMSWISEDVHESRAWVVKTDSNGCIIPGCTTDFITEKEPHKDLFLLSPNPTQDYVNVYMNDVEFYDRKYYLNLYDQQGRIVQHHVVQGRVTQVDLSSLPAGMYYYRIVNERNKFMQSGKVVVNR